MTCCPAHSGIFLVFLSAALLAGCDMPNEVWQAGPEQAPAEPVPATADASTEAIDPNGNPAAKAMAGTGSGVTERPAEGPIDAAAHARVGAGTSPVGHSISPPAYSVQSTPPTDFSQPDQLTIQAYPVTLSTGVALAQTLPDGTAMGFSVEYRFAGGPSPSRRYLWVIKPGRGDPLAKEVQLGTEGTLMDFVLQWRPEDGPFECHLEEVGTDGTRRVLSKVLPLQ